MSNFLAIATVTAALQRVLQESVQTDVDGATATTLLPDESNQGNLPNPGVNIYLYQATPNASWRNADLPTRTRSGILVHRPSVALDLHYLLTFYGDDSALEPQRVMGSVVRTLHARPMITHDIIAELLEAASLEDPEHYLLPSNVADELESVKFTPSPFTLEELSKLWSVFFQTAYALSIAYTGSVVLIEGDEPPRRALPVRVPSITVFPFRRAIIDRIVNADDEEAPIVFGDTILIRGRQLGGTIVHVRVGLRTLPVDSVDSDGIRVVLDDPDLRAGVVGVQVVYEDGTTSSVAALVLRPAISVGTPVVPSPGVDVHVPLTVDPPVAPSQPVTLFLNEFDPPTDGSRAPHAYSFQTRLEAESPPASPPDAATGELTFVVSNVPPATYLVRLEVSGAESVLDVDLTGSPPSGRYIGPTVTIP